ncbi:MAG: hypothetical protein HOH74_15705, partial [Gemmatimonadetes bacterium]|nr:hypothetical protein [Gemmatimonadota bacterium]
MTALTPIPLHVTGAAGVDNWPLTRGVPLPEGALHNVDGLLLVDSDGGVVPHQVRILSRWPNGSLKWVLLDFQGRGNTTYQLTQTTSTQSLQEGVQIEDTPAAIQVCTGRMRFTVRRDRVGLFEDLQLGTRSQGVFTPAAILTGTDGARIWARIREGESLGGTKRRIYGMGGECRASLAPDDWSVEIEEAGPLRTVITCRGALELYAPMHHYGGYQPLRFVLRIHAFAGQAFVRLQHTILFCLNPRETEVEELGLHLPLASGSGPQTCRAEQVDRVFPFESAGELLLAQQADNHFRLLSSNGEQNRVAEGERTNGWLTREHAGGGLGVGLRHMAEEFPKALRARVASDDVLGGIDTLPWHDPAGGHLRLTRYAEEVAWHEGEGVYADGTGTAKTTELFATWFESGAAGSAIDDLQRLLDPPHVAVEPVHMAHCGVTGGFEPASSRFPRSERMLAGFVDWLSRQIRLGRWYGFFDFGDALVAWEEATNDWRFNGRWGWCNSEWDPRHGVWIQYLRTGDPALFHLGEAMTRHSVDVDTCHWHAFRPYFVGGGYRHSVDHFGDEPCASHTFIDNWVDHYYLTGDLRTLEVLREAGEFLRRYRWTEDPQFSFSLRSIGNTLRGLLYTYEVTGDKSLLQRAIQVYEVIARGQNDDGSWHKRFQVSTADRLPEQLPY